MEKHVFAELIPDYATNKEAALDTRSPIAFADKICPTTPLLLMQGTADWRADAGDAIAMADRLYKLKHPFRFVLFEGATHGLREFGKERDRDELMWFDDYVRDGKKLPDLTPHGR